MVGVGGRETVVNGLMSETTESADIARLLRAAGQGDRAAFDELFPLVYDVLRRIARRKLAGERPDHTLATTDLVHEAYLKLVRLDRIEWKGRAFLASAQACGTSSSTTLMRK
jgi:DNA-directed RNA polymerase specialized sigma24 family protein